MMLSGLSGSGAEIRTGARTSWRAIVWAASVGVVLADSSIVTLALPEILAEYDTTVFGVSWVLTAFNLVLALAVVPAARFGRHRPAPLWAVSMVVFAIASAGCAFAPSIAALIALRLLQALAGAAILATAIEMIAAERGSHGGGAELWGVAGTAGLALGPAVGGALTEILSWESIFLLQIPMLAGVIAARGAAAPLPETAGGADSGGRGRNAELSLALLSAGLTGALFLLVILLTEGWGLSPLAAAGVVSVMPATTFVIRAFPGGTPAGLALAGAVGTVAGLAALGLLPDAEPFATMPPQILIGAGLALSIPVLTARALERDDATGRRSVETIAARHLGIVVGIVLLTPLLSAQLETQHEAATAAGTSVLLDAELDPETKIELGTEIGEQVDGADGRLPEIGPAFAVVAEGASGTERSQLAVVEADLGAEIEKAATHAFMWPFIGTAVFALLAIAPMLAGAGRVGAIGAPVLLAAGGGLALVTVYAALGGGAYKPLEPADPCLTRSAELLESRGLVEGIGLSALDGAACELGVGREELTIALADEGSRAEFAERLGLDEAEIEAAVRAGLLRAVEDAESSGRLGGLPATLLREAAEQAPIGVVIDLLEAAPGDDPFETIVKIVEGELGLEDIVDVPDLPELPDLPDLGDLPDLPDLGELPDLPALPEAGDL